MRLNKVAASRRSKKGWETRRRTNPSKYGNVRTKGGKTYWERPNGQKVRLKGFSPTEVNQLKPAFVATDVSLKSHVRPQVKTIKKERIMGFGTGGFDRRPGYAYYQTGFITKPKIRVDGRTFHKRGVNPAGIVQHEIGHSIYPGVKTPHTRHKQFRQAFGYRKRRYLPERDVQRYTRIASNQIPKRKTRQGVDAAEDFAETYRHLTGQRISNRAYWQPEVDIRRLQHMKVHYLR